MDLRDSEYILLRGNHKIGLFLAGPPYGSGSSHYSRSMLEAVASLPREEFQIIVLYLCDEWDIYLKDYDFPSKVVKLRRWEGVFNKFKRLLCLPMSTWRRILRFFHPVAKALIQQNCDLWIFPCQSVWSHQASVPALVTILDLMHRYERERGFSEVSANRQYKFREEHFIQMSKWAKGILVDSELGKQQVTESYGTSPDKIYVLPYVPPKHIYSLDRPKDFDRRYILPRRFLFYPAQFFYHKNHTNLIKAVSRLMKKYPDISLILVGSKKNAYESVCNMVQKLKLTKNIMVFGYVSDEDLAEFYRRARGMIMPTFFGPTNIPPLEANALGCPVAVSKVYAMPDQLGNAALYFDPSSIEEIANVIEKIWTDDALCSALRERGFIRARQWDQSHFNKRLFTIIKKILC